MSSWSVLLQWRIDFSRIPVHKGANSRLGWTNTVICRKLSTLTSSSFLYVCSLDAWERSISFSYTVAIQVKVQGWLIHRLQFLSQGKEMFCLLCVRDHLIWLEPFSGIVKIFFSVCWILSIEWSEAHNEKEGKSPTVLFSYSFFLNSTDLTISEPGTGYICSDMGIPIPQTLVIGAYPSHITLAIWVRVRVTGDVHITRVLGMGMPKMRRCPYQCDTGTKTTPGGIGLVFTH